MQFRPFVELIEVLGRRYDALQYIVPNRAEEIREILAKNNQFFGGENSGYMAQLNSPWIARVHPGDEMGDIQVI